MKVFIKDLHEGLHERHEAVTAESLSFPDPESYPQLVIIDLVIDRLDNIYRMKINVRTQAKQVCDRCLDEYTTDLHEVVEQIYQLGTGMLDDDEDVVVLPVDTREIDISDAIREVVVMSRPIKLLCSEQCKGLCPHCGVNRNQKQCKCDADEIDPRLETLKSLLN